MTPKSKKALIVIVSLLAIGGGVGYFLWKRKKDKVKAEEEAKAKADAEAKAKADAEANANANTNTNTNTNQGGSPTGYTFPFTNVTEGDAFRGWVNKTYPDYAKSIKLDPTGTLNSFVQKAWDKYGAEYTKSTAPAVTKPTKPPIVPPKNIPSPFKKGDRVYAKTKLAGYKAINDDGRLIPADWKNNEFYVGGTFPYFGNFGEGDFVGVVKGYDPKTSGLLVFNNDNPMQGQASRFSYVKTIYNQFWVYAPFVRKG